MNCKQCGAPMSVEEGRDFFHCEYCDSYDFPDPNQDGVSLLDEVSHFDCPICRKPLVLAAVRNVHISSCPNCRGNLVDQSKMLPILSQAQSLDPTNETSYSPQTKSELSRTLVCPACQKIMNAYPYGGPGNIIIQGCEECRLIWLDFGELSTIIRAYGEMYSRSPDELGAKKKWIAF
jgi:Zn-finger nucleic acid-binding protein